MTFWLWIYCTLKRLIFAFGHRMMKIEVPVRSPVLNHHADRLVVGWVTTSESLLLNVFDFLTFRTNVRI